VGFGPQLADLNGDGRFDMISGGFTGKVYFWEREESGEFGARQILSFTSNEAIESGEHIALAACDWDGDGDPDLLLGALDGEVFLLLNKGTKKQAKFGELAQLVAGNAPIKVDRCAGPCAADWDCDGLPDLLVGDAKGNVTLYRNGGTRKAPALAKGRLLLKGRGGRRISNICDKRACASYAKPCVVDWNADGRPDLLVGDHHDHREPDEMARGLNHPEQKYGCVWLYLRAPTDGERAGG
jgi:hypothetical protein